MKREYYKWWSPRLRRDMELLVFGHAGARVLVFPTRCGRFFDYENFGMLGAVADRIRNGWLQLYCVDSVDSESFYADWKQRQDRIHWHNLYESYLLREVIPLSDYLNPGSFLMTHGCSLGAYHAVNLALRHPAVFPKAVAFSGRYDLTESSPGFRDLFEGHIDHDIYMHMPTRYLPHVSHGPYLEQLQRLELIVTTGEHDPFRDSAHRLSEVLRRKGARCDMQVWPGRAHHRRDWAHMARVYL